MSGKARPTNPWFALAALSVGFFMIMLDTTIVNIAIPTIQRDIGADLNQVVWVNSAYLLTYAVPLLLSGRLGDQLGRRRMLIGGIAVFTLASLACGLAPNPDALVAARAVQGLGAAMLAPQTMAVITHLFPPDDRGAPLGVWGGVGALAAAVGPVAGGILVDGWGWRWIFVVNVPVGVVGLLLAVWLVPDVQGKRDHHLDIVGVVLSGVGLLALVFGLQNGQQYHWGDVVGDLDIAEILGCAVVLLAAFVGWQHRKAREPLLPLSLFAYANFSPASVAALCVAFALTGMYLPLTIYIQSVLGLSPLMAGLTTMPTAIGAVIAGPVVGRLARRVGGTYLVMTGVVLFAAGVATIAVVARTTTDPWTLRYAFFVCGLGAGAAFSSLVNVATRSVPLPAMGAASGVYNTARQIGSVVGSAAIGVVLQGRLAATMHQAAVAHAGALAAPLRGRFVHAIDAASGTATATGALTAAHATTGMTGAVAAHVDALARQVFREAFTKAVQGSLLLPVGVLAIGLVACVVMAVRGGAPAASPAPSTRQREPAGRR